MLWNKQDVIKYLEKNKEGDIYDITRKTKKTLISEAQRKYYFWVIIEITWGFHWHTPPEQHEMLKSWFKLTTTTWLSMSEYAMMCNLIIDLYETKFWVIIPLPSTIHEDESLYKSLGF